MNIYKKVLCLLLAALIAVSFGACSFAAESDRTPADLVVYGKIFTSEGNNIVEAFAVKDGKYVYVGDKKGAEAFVEAGKTEVVDYTGKGLVMPGCGNGHAHYMLGYALKTIGTTINLDDTPEKFLSEIVPAAVKNAKAKGATAVFGHGWNFMSFKDNLPTRQQLDAICSDMPMYFLDDECHKALVNTALLVKAGILKEDGTAGKTEIRGGEIGVDANGIPTGYLVEQAQTYVRSFLDDIYTLDMATANVAEIERYMLSTGYTMYHEGWGNYFVNTNYYQAVKQLDEAGKLHFVLGLPYEFESWMNVDEALARAIDAKKFASKRVMPRWIKLLMDGTVETGTGFVDPLYPGGRQGIPNWTEEELTYITRKANENGLTMHIHVMGNKGVNCVVNAFVNGGKDEMRNALVHVHTVNEPDYKRMADHNIYVVASLHWHHATDEARELLLKALPEGMGDKSYPIKSFFDYGITASSHSDYPALAGSPDDPFGIMEIAVTGIYYPEKAKAWWPEELITREQALTALTINVAKQMFVEDERGSIKEGKYADFLLVNKDVLTCPAEEIHTAKPEATYFEGKKVFSAESAEGAPDYSRKDCWYQIPEIAKDVDTFFIYPTEYMGFNEGDPDYATLDNAEMRKGAEGDYIGQASVYEESTNVFVPYYRQAGMPRMGRAWKETGDCESAISGIPYDDITAALDYYFKNCNNGRPFILAGHSQGSAIARLVLKKYFKEHPEYYERMIAAYVIGYSVTKDDLKANPHLKFATGETDTGVIISWNTEGKGNVDANVSTAPLLPNAISINPLNWKLDDTYAPASENLGSLTVNENGEPVIADIGADAQVVPERGTVVTNAKVEPMPEELARVASEFFGPDGRHESDYSFYYNNIKDNVAKRIEAYKASKTLSKTRENLIALYGENKRITDGNYDKSLAVKCINGTFVGKKNDGVIAYKGIPFVGKQPVGELRWKAPVDVVPDDGVYEAYYNGKTPVQVEDLYEGASLYVQGEDCLYLNVWKADEASSEKKPVMVWIHGGAYEMGGTVDPVYELHNFVKENPDVIAVSIEYRLGVFGFFHLSHLPDGKDYPDAQNLGLMDQIMALKWVHENIASFGGDPDNVTIFGESAGGGSVCQLPLVKGSHEYFKKVIAQSGGVVFTRSTEQAIECTNEVMDILGCKTVADLQKVDVRKFVNEAAVLGLRVMPEKDGKYLPLDPYEAYANGAAKDIDFMQGCNKDEMNYFMVSIGGIEPFMDFYGKRWAKSITQLTDEEKALAESFCNDIKGDSYEPLCRLYDQIWFIAPLFRMSENQTKAGGKSYTYFFTVEASVPLMKSGHAVELASVLNHPEETLESGRAFDETFTKTMRKMWVQFAKTGNPSLSADISPDGKAHVWPLYDLKDKEIMVFDEFNIHPEKESESKLLDWERCYFLTKYFCL